MGNKDKISLSLTFLWLLAILSEAELKYALHIMQ